MDHAKHKTSKTISQSQNILTIYVTLFFQLCIIDQSCEPTHSNSWYLFVGLSVCLSVTQQLGNAAFTQLKMLETIPDAPSQGKPAQQ